ncbi:hypothetical protein [Bosea sp. (in: a-proteobacteria)]|uniref:hypothetical protein n=1 Tax=Bosea sp. (in: a-proteobacteria) TaxID=1871050 RepID=UPI002FC69042
MAAQVTFERALAPLSAVRPELAQNALRTLRPGGGGAAGLLLALRYIQARFLSVWGLLIAALLCPPQIFADFAIYSALANFLSIAALLRFEAVFFQNSDPDRLGRAFRLSLAAGCGFLALVALAAFASSTLGLVLAGHAALFVLSLAGRAAIRLATAEATAEGDFRAIGNAGLVQALVQPGAMLALILPFGASSLALFAADAIGHAVSASYLGWRRRFAFQQLALRADWSLHELRRSARQWSAAPRFLLPSALLSFGFSVAPLFALPFTTDPVFAAHVALAMRLLDVPTQMFGAVTLPLVMSSLRNRQGPARRRWARLLTVGLVVVAFALFAGVAGFALILDPWLEETQWHGIGTVLAILTLFYSGIALVSPLNEIGTLSRDPQHPMVTNAIAAVAMIAIIAWFGTLSLAMLFAVGGVSLLRMTAHACLTWTGFGGRGPAGTLPQGSRII